MFLEIEWTRILTEVILAVVGLAITTLSGLLTYWINTKIKSEKGKRLLNEALGIVTNGVQYVNQIYVDALKGTDKWDEQAQQVAKEKALTYVKNNLSEDAINFIKGNFSDVTEWIETQIEIAIQNEK